MPTMWTAVDRQPCALCSSAVQCRTSADAFFYTPSSRAGDWSLLHLEPRKTHETEVVTCKTTAVHRTPPCLTCLQRTQHLSNVFCCAGRSRRSAYYPFVVQACRLRVRGPNAIAPRLAELPGTIQKDYHVCSQFGPLQQNWLSLRGPHNPNHPGSIQSLSCQLRETSHTLTETSRTNLGGERYPWVGSG